MRPWGLRIAASVLVVGGALVACTSALETEDGAPEGTTVKCHSGRTTPELIAQGLVDATRAGDRQKLCELLPPNWSIDDTTWAFLTSRIPDAGQLLLVENTQERIGDLSWYSLLDDTGTEVLRLRILCPMADDSSECHVLLGAPEGNADVSNETSAIERPQTPGP